MIQLKACLKSENQEESWIRGTLEITSVLVQKKSSILHTFLHIKSHYKKPWESIHCMVDKVRSTLVAGQHAKIIYALAENLSRFVTQNITTTYRVQIDKIQHNTIHALCFLL